MSVESHMDPLDMPDDMSELTDIAKLLCQWPVFGRRVYHGINKGLSRFHLVSQPTNSSAPTTTLHYTPGPALSNGYIAAFRVEMHQTKRVSFYQTECASNRMRISPARLLRIFATKATGQLSTSSLKIRPKKTQKEAGRTKVAPHNFLH